MGVDIFTKRGITPPWEPDGHVARAQGFERYEGSGWRERRAAVAAVEPLFGERGHPDPWKSRQAWTTWLRGALAVDGWAMPRWAPMPDHENWDFRLAPVAQLRPDVPVFGHFERHSHRQITGWGRGGKPVRRLRDETRGREEASARRGLMRTAASFGSVETGRSTVR